MTGLSRTDSLGGDNPFNISTNGTSNGNGNGNGIRMGKAIPPRLDLEPIYTQLKLAIGENMNLYRDSVGAYMMGMLCYLSFLGRGFMTGQYRKAWEYGV